MLKPYTAILLFTGVLHLESQAQRMVPYGSALEGGLGVFDMDVYQGSLVVAGHFSSFRGHQRRNLQAWNGETHGDLPGAFEGSGSVVYALEVFQGDLYVGGYENNSRSLARWDGSAWTWISLSEGVRVKALATFGGTLVCAGSDGGVHELVGGEWSALGQEFNGGVAALAVHEGVLYAAGEFTGSQGTGVQALRLARWNGSDWEQVLSGLNGPVSALVSTPSGLIVAGAFTSDGSGELELHGHVRVANEAFHEPEFIEGLGVIQGACAHPYGGYLISGDETVHVFGDVKQRISFRAARACIDYADSLLIGGSNSGSWSSYKPTGGIGAVLQGEDNTGLEINGIRAQCMPIPQLFRRGIAPGFEVPRGSGRHTLYHTSPWFISSTDTLLYSAIPGSGWAPGDSMWTYAGPYADVMDEEHFRQYHQVWKIDRAQVLAHGTHWASPDYTTPAVISRWPAHGYPMQGGPEYLAPFVDENGDGVYDPSLGDRPSIRGDQAVYWVMHTEDDAIEGTEDMELDIHVQAYGYEGYMNAAVRNTVFVNYKVINRSDQVYSNLRFGQFVQFNLGCDVDDRLECDSTRSLFMAYNGDAFDDDCNGDLGYGDRPTAQGVKFLNHHMESFRARFPQGSNGEQAHYWDMLHGTWNGAPLTYPGLTTTYQFPGGANTDNIAFPLDRGSVGAFQANDIAPGDTLCIDLAFIFAQAASGGPHASVDALKLRSDSVQAFYDSVVQDCRSMPSMVSVGELNGAMALVVQPNPAEELVWVSSPGPLGEVFLLDIQGRLLQREDVPEARHVLSLAHLSPGPYLISVRNALGVRVARVIKE